MKKILVLLIIGIFSLSLVSNAFSASPPFHDGDLDYNCYPTDACNAASTEPGTYILDVRTPSEWIWVGHPGKNKVGAGVELEGKVLNIPWSLWKFDNKTVAFVMVGNDHFEEDVQQAIDELGITKIITMCRSGTRSVYAAEVIEAMGIPAINMLTGFEGGTDSSTGYRTKNGWKVDSCPYNYSATGVYLNRKALNKEH
ncbi:MAG: hypothetical protein L6416_02065 [Candidatus Omnitrophica bacterium]|nr:hypothetical protein [Candidatus Omnitrophota bacterium]